VIETAEEAINKNPSQNRINEILSREAEDFKKHLKGYVVVLDLQGEKTSSIGFSEILKNLMNGGVSEISFLIGSSYGISQEIRELADKRISFSDMTFPHGLFRVMLLEQIYRAFTIQNNITYHK
jgi:23S rRNA (pseudouridine1915-N3)-methyltransferase